jgi:putative endonuclease
MAPVAPTLVAAKATRGPCARDNGQISALWDDAPVGGHTDDRTRTAAQLAGDSAEALVASRLEASGWTVLARNVHVGRRELDLVAVDPGPPRSLVIVEVRWRGRRDFGLGEETVNWRKRRHLHEAAFELLDGLPLPDGSRVPVLPVRFDLVVVEPTLDRDQPLVRHHRAAV